MTWQFRSWKYNPYKWVYVSTRDLYKNVQSSYVLNSPKLETSCVPLCGRLDRSAVYSIILLHTSWKRKTSSSVPQPGEPHRHCTDGRSQMNKSTCGVVPLSWSSRTAKLKQPKSEDRFPLGVCWWGGDMRDLRWGAGLSSDLACVGVTRGSQMPKFNIFHHPLCFTKN